MINKVIFFTAIVFVNIIFIGCNTPNSIQKISGIAIDGYLRGATICIDRNLNKMCDSDEPSGTDGQGEFNTLEDCTISECMYGVSIGNTQARNFMMYGNSLMYYLHTCFTNVDHGMKFGKLSGIITNLSVYASIQLANISTQISELKFDSCYGEAIYRFGNIGAHASTNKSLILDNCAFNFYKGLNNPVPKSIFGGDFATVNIRGGQMHFEDYPYIHVSYGLNFIVNDTHIDNYYEPQDTAEAIMHNALKGFINPMGNKNIKIHSDTFNIDTLAKVNINNNYYEPGIHYGRSVTLPAQIETTQYPTINVNVKQKETVIDPNGNNMQWQFVNISGRDVKIDIGVVNSDKYIMYGLDIGDLVYKQAEETMFYIQDRESDILTLRALSNYDENGLINGFDLSNGYIYHIHSRATFIKGTEIIFHFTEGSNEVTINRVIDGYDKSINQHLSVGDRIMMVDDLAGVFPLDEIVPKITQIDEASGIIYLEKPAKMTKSGIGVLVSRSFKS